MARIRPRSNVIEDEDPPGKVPRLLKNPERLGNITSRGLLRDIPPVTGSRDLKSQSLVSLTSGDLPVIVHSALPQLGLPKQYYIGLPCSFYAADDRTLMDPRTLGSTSDPTQARCWLQDPWEDLIVFQAKEIKRILQKRIPANWYAGRYRRNVPKLLDLPRYLRPFSCGLCYFPNARRKGLMIAFATNHGTQLLRNTVFSNLTVGQGGCVEFPWVWRMITHLVPSGEKRCFVPVDPPVIGKCALCGYTRTLTCMYRDVCSSGSHDEYLIGCECAERFYTVFRLIRALLKYPTEPTHWPT